jgi:hypothetical protein
MVLGYLLELSQGEVVLNGQAWLSFNWVLSKNWPKWKEWIRGLAFGRLGVSKRVCLIFYQI